jgi:mercuric ion transport protein
MNDSSTNSCCEPARTPAVLDNVAIGRTQKLVAAGGILGAIAASACCIAPLALFSLGVSGAWIGNLTALAPYQPYFNRNNVACAEGGACARPLPSHIVKAGLILATILVASAIAFDLFAPLLLNS